MSTPLRQEREKQWQEHARRAEAHAKGMVGYCRSAGITISALNYWRAKFKARIVSQERKIAPAFLPVQGKNSAEHVYFGLGVLM